jgi:hypothetical protein
MLLLARVQRHCAPAVERPTREFAGGAKPPGARLVHFTTVTLKAEHVVAICADDVAVSEPRLAVAATLAEMSRILGSMELSLRHGDLHEGHDIERP